MLKLVLTVGAGRRMDGSYISDITRSGYRAAIRAALLDAFDGYSEQDLQGAWRDSDGRVVSEVSVQWTILVQGSEPGRVTLADRLRALASARACARRACDVFCQSCVLLETGSEVNAEFVTAQPEPGWFQ